MKIRSALSVLVAAAIVGASQMTQAQAPQAAPPGGARQGGGAGAPPPAGPLTFHQLTPAVYWVEGGVGNVGVIIGDKGVVLVDTTISADGAKQLLEGIAKITPKPVTTVLITHGDQDHTGGLAGLPAGLTVIAQNDNKQRMADAVAAGRSRLPADHLPNRGVDKREAVTLEGVKMELLHWAPAHTAGDLVVFLPAQKIVFTGDIFAMNQPRALIHHEQQGSSEGWVTTARAMLALNADRYVVGHGDVASKATLQERFNLVSGEREQIKKLVAQGKSLADIQAAVGDPPPGNAQGGGMRFAPFSEVVYQELTGK